MVRVSGGSPFHCLTCCAIESKLPYWDSHAVCTQIAKTFQCGGVINYERMSA